MTRRGLLLVLACAACAACTEAAPDHPRVTPLASGEARYQELVALLANDPATGRPVDSMAELLPLLSDDLRGNFTLVHTTRAPLHDVDPVHPRAVLFGSDARVVVAFTGDPGGPDRDVLEVIRYRDDARAFELERFVLPAAARRDPALATLARDNGAPNPRECLRCHGADPRPIFDSYPVWPGFYGSGQDAFELEPGELANYRKFLAAKAAPTSLYHLLAFPPGSPVSPYSLATAEDPTGKLAPNMRFGMALTELNRARISRMLEASPHYQAYRDQLVAGMLGCVAMPIGTTERAHIVTALADENRAKLDVARVTDPVMRQKLRMTEVASAANVTELDYLARVLEVSRADWSMAAEPGSLSLYDGILSGRVGTGDSARDFYIKEDFLYELLRGLAAADPRVATIFATKPYAIAHRVGARLDLPRAIAGCDVFAARARARGGITWPARLPTPPTVTYRCVRCHEAGGDGPAIPFDLPARMAAALRAQPELSGAIAARTAPATDATDRMPLGEPALTASEHDELLAYIAAVNL